MNQWGNLLQNRNPDQRGEPTAESEPEPTGEPTAESEPEPTGEPTAESEPEPKPTGEPTAESEPEPKPTGEPTAESEPEPTGEPTAESEPEPTGEPTAESEPEPKPTGEPTAESEPEPEPTGEPTAESEPEPTGEPTAESEPEPAEVPPFAEPVPDWDEALPLYGFFWEIHIYILASLFALLALYSLVSLIRLRKRRLLSYGYFVALNLMMLVMGLDRAVYLFVDAYNHKNIFPLSLAYMLLGLGFPCLSSAFSILFLALLHSTQTRLVSPKIQRAKVLAAMIAFHFTVSVVIDIVVGLFTSAQVLLLLCQGVFLIWGLFLSVSYLVIFRRLHISSVRQFRESTRLSMRKRSSSLYGISPFMKKPRNNWSSAIKVTLFTSFLGVTIGLLQLYGILVVYGPLGEKVPEPWSWVSYQLVFRICEFAMCVLMSYVATQPFRYTVGGQEKPMCMYCSQDFCNVFVGKTSHDINVHDVDSYRLVTGEFDASLQGNDRAMAFDPKPTHPLHAANLQLSTDAFYKGNTNDSFNENTSHSTETNGTVTDHKTNSLSLKIPRNSIENGNTAALNNKNLSASAPISTQNGDPFRDNCTHMVRNDLSPGDIKLCNVNKNNHHSCPCTPLLQERNQRPVPNVVTSRHSLSNLQSFDDNSSPLTPTGNQTPENTESSRTHNEDSVEGCMRTDEFQADNSDTRAGDSESDLNTIEL